MIRSRQGKFALNRECKDAKSKCNALKNKRHNEITSSGQKYLMDRPPLDGEKLSN